MPTCCHLSPLYTRYTRSLFVLSRFVRAAHLHRFTRIHTQVYSTLHVPFSAASLYHMPVRSAPRLPFTYHFTSAWTMVWLPPDHLGSRFLHLHSSRSAVASPFDYVQFHTGSDTTYDALHLVLDRCCPTSTYLAPRSPFASFVPRSRSLHTSLLHRSHTPTHRLPAIVFTTVCTYRLPAVCGYTTPFILPHLPTDGWIHLTVYLHSFMHIPHTVTPHHHTVTLPRLDYHIYGSFVQLPYVPRTTFLPHTYVPFHHYTPQFTTSHTRG